MEIVIKKLNDLKQYKRNAKLHPEWQIEQIKKSIEKFGFNDPIAIDEKNVIIEGHGRFLACKMLGMDMIPVIILNHLTVQEKKAYIIAHNKINMNTGFDDDILKMEIEDLKEFDFDLDLTGITDFEIDNLLEDKENDTLELEDYEETDAGNSKKINGLVCPECGSRHNVKDFLECEVDG
ncbi:MAG: ParB/Srx family N-terminal domain-containing protein [Fusobacteriaceae bacterium]